MRKRDKGLYVRCGEDELAAWKQAASKEGLGHSEWIRRTLTKAAFQFVNVGGDSPKPAALEKGPAFKHGGTTSDGGFITPAESAVDRAPTKSCRLERFHRKDAYCVACERTQ